MAKRLTPSTVLDETTKIKQMWIENPTFTIPGLTPADQAAKVTQIEAKEAEIDAARVHLTGLIEQRDGMTRDLNSWNVRARRGVGFTFGLESPQYKQVGGTPPSERKPRTAKAKPAD
jgi:hypothetical protein